MSIDRTPEIKAFIRKNAHLFWYVPNDKKLDISDEVLVEIILNYGTWDDVKEMKELLGNKYIYVGLHTKKKPSLTNSTFGVLPTLGQKTKIKQ